MTQLERHGSVFVLPLGDDENRFHPDRVAAINAALDEVDGADGPRAVVTTGPGKFYSNGLDLDFMAANPDAAEANLTEVPASRDIIGTLVQRPHPQVVVRIGMAPESDEVAPLTPRRPLSDILSVSA